MEIEIFSGDSLKLLLEHLMILFLSFSALTPIISGSLPHPYKEEKADS